MPPSWAQKPGVAEDPDHVQRAAAALYGEGVDISRMRCWRRKLIKHHDSVRPPFYGSVPRTSRCVCVWSCLGRASLLLVHVHEQHTDSCHAGK